MDNVGEDAIKDLKGIVLVGGTFCGIFLEIGPASMRSESSSFFLRCNVWGAEYGPS
jgi:hypothetical protein